MTAVLSIVVAVTAVMMLDGGGFDAYGGESDDNFVTGIVKKIYEGIDMLPLWSFVSVSPDPFPLVGTSQWTSIEERLTM